MSTKRIVLFRHGEAIKAPNGDGGLTERGLIQAVEAAKRFQRVSNSIVFGIASSPMKRAVETADQIAQVLGAERFIEKSLSEAPVPIKDGKPQYPDSWTTASLEMRKWRSDLIAFVMGCDHDQFLVTHFLAINAIVGHVQRDTAVVVCHPPYGSVTILREGSVWDIGRSDSEPMRLTA